ncbi:hypothetical protein GOODEAATRI_028127 [Goodea atripinnis]|uniref:Ig-like domain-containing protein n=1 Tax=Goodea atripinnis TaxID=208336 RepID=A0ABV0Q2L9_9TELE
MWSTAVEQTLYLGLVLSRLVGEGSAVKVFCRPGQGASLPCLYDYEDQTNIEQLTMRWTSPHKQLLCHYIKHRNYQNCSTGYTMNYRPGSIKLTIQQVQTRDLGIHVCSVGKPHESFDFSIDLAMMAESVTSAPAGGGNQADHTWSLTVLALTCLLLCM